ncbi:hypothetical protein AB0D34_39645 [Streptomyces sp. NPDC048420]|uniref:WXG100 family type VII secretion target n=1 Tax=Streptomyces sp. NPDC048420 TaxID=3155755 RepID=UPI00342C3A3A
MSEREYDYLPPGRGYASKHTTPFATKSLPQLKAMVEHADPENARTVARGWDAFRADLVAGEDGGALGMLSDLVDRLLQSWRGEAAEAFRVEAERFLRKIDDTAEHARYLAIAVRGAANALQEYKPHIDAMTPSEDTPGSPGPAGKGLKDLKGRENAEDLLKAGGGELSAAKRHDLKAAVAMEQLGAAYNSQSDAMGSWSRVTLADPNCPGAPDGTVPRAEVRPIPRSVSPSQAPPPPRPAEPPSPPGPGGVVKTLRSHTEAASTTGVPGVIGGIARQDSARGGDRSIPNGVLGAADPFQTPGPAAPEGDTGSDGGREQDG